MATQRARASGSDNQRHNTLPTGGPLILLGYGKGFGVVKVPLHIIPPILFCGRTSQ
jgi:hypothetical protein